MQSFDAAALAHAYREGTLRPADVVEDALALNQDIDNDGNDANANFVRWTTLSAADGLVTLGLYLPIADLC